MTDRTDRTIADWFGHSDLTAEQREVFAAYAEIQDIADSIHGVPPVDEIGGAGTMEIAKILTCFPDRIDDEWRHNLIMLAAGLLNLMRANHKDSDHG